jgi:predicted nucleic acid-binding protein
LPGDAERLVVNTGPIIALGRAIERGIGRVCIDEWRGRRAAVAAGLTVTGALGLIGRAKHVGLIPAVRPWVEKMAAAGIHYHPDLLAKFLAAIGESA